MRRCVGAAECEESVRLSDSFPPKAYSKRFGILRRISANSIFQKNGNNARSLILDRLRYFLDEKAEGVDSLCSQIELVQLESTKQERQQLRQLIDHGLLGHAL